MNQDFFKEVDSYVKSLDTSRIIADDTRLEGYRVYYFNAVEVEDMDQMIFAIIKLDTLPMQLNLLCDTQLAKLLRERYESVLPSKLMNPKQWNKIICSGQLELSELKDLINLSYQLISA